MSDLKISKKRLNKIQHLIKEEFDREWTRRNMIEVVNDDDEISVICESARQKIRLQEGVFAQLGAKMKGLGAKAAAAGGNIGTAFKMAAAAAKGDQEGIQQLGSELQNVNLAGQVKQATTLVQAFNKKSVALYTDFAENFAKLGLTELPEVEELVMQLMDASDNVPEQLENIISKLEGTAKQVQDVAKKTGAAEAAKQGGGSEEQAGQSAAQPTTGGGKRPPPDDAKKPGAKKDDEKKKLKTGGDSGMAGAAKQMGSAMGLT